MTPDATQACYTATQMSPARVLPLRGSWSNLDRRSNMISIAEFLASLSPEERTQLEARFWSKVDRSGGPDACWPWLAKPRTDGYGRFKLRYKIQSYAHAMASILVDGPASAGICFCHSCDARYPVRDISYRKCCNPTHVWRGTHAQNMADMVVKGRSLIGANNPKRLSYDECQSRVHPVNCATHGKCNGNAKLTDEKVRSIIRRYNDGESQNAIALDLGVSRGLISHVWCRRNWAHVELK